jgi:BirA family transcriptional regulator, biotin operon repressor / biotin---[acetyl-CoA-carboxylase] ligase
MDTPGATWRAADEESGSSTWVREWPRGWQVEIVAETGSTNADLLAAAARGAADRSVLASLHQTAGRGRLDRTWDAPPGANLLVSILIRELPAHLHQITQRLALAAVVAVQRAAGVEARLKWPNDVLLDGRKLAGVLAQAGGASGAGVGYVVAGIGLNVGWAPPEAAKLGEHVQPADVLAALLSAWDDLPADITDTYRAALATLGAEVAVHLPGVDGAASGEVVRGRALDVEIDGRLVVVDDCATTHRFATGDVVHLR